MYEKAMKSNDLRHIKSSIMKMNTREAWYVSNLQPVNTAARLLLAIRDRYRADNQFNGRRKINRH